MDIKPLTDKALADWVSVSPVVLYALSLHAGVVSSLWVSETVQRVTGYTRDQALEPGWWQRNIHPDDQHRATQAFGRLSERGEIAHEYRFRHASGEWVWIRDELRFSEREEGVVVGTWSDITPIKRAQRAAEEAVLESIRRLEESEQRYRSLLETNPNPVYWLSEDGRFTAVNAAASKLAGRSESQLVGMSYSEIVHPDDQESSLEAFLMAWKGASHEYELRVVRPDGELRYVRGISAPMKVDGRIVGVYGVATDETERLAEQQRRQELEAQLHRAQKMEAVGRLAGGVAHDFNNLLTGLRGLVGLRLEDLPEDDPVRGDFEEVDQIAERASMLVRQLLAFSRNQVMHSRVLDLNGLVHETERMLQRILGEDVVLETDLVEEETGIRADPAQVQQVIMNLVVNARHAMPQGGQLWIRTRNEVGLPDEHGRTHDIVVLEVEDTGFGISPEIQERIFDPFFTTKGAGEGTGLGLSTVYGVVHQSGGEVMVESEPGEGSTFRVLLPRIPLEEEEPAEAARPPADGEQAGTVLVVEDEPTVRKLISRILKRKGYGVVEAVSAGEALDWLADSPALDLMISDVIMPGMSGPDLVARMREFRPDMPVLMISGYDEDRLTQLPEGRTAFLPKPFTPAELTDRVEKLLRVETA